MDLALPGQEHEHVARTDLFELGDGVDDRLHLVSVVSGNLADRPVADLDGKRPAGHLDDRGVDAVGGEVVGEARRVDRRRRDDDREIRPLRQQLAQVPEDEVDVEAAFVGLVDDQRVVPAEEAVALDLGEEDAVGHHANEGLLADTVVEAHGVADGRPDGRAQLTGEALGDRPGGDPSRLRVPDQPGHTPAGLDAHLGQLGALARSGLAGDDEDLLLAEGGEQLVVPGTDRQFLGIRDRPRGDQRVANSRDGGQRLHGGPHRPVWRSVPSDLVRVRQRLDTNRVANGATSSSTSSTSAGGSLLRVSWARSAAKSIGVLSTPATASTSRTSWAMMP